MEGGEEGERCNVLLGTMLALLSELGLRSVGTREPHEGVKGQAECCREHWYSMHLG